MSYETKPFYLKFPIFQIIYIIFWIPIGYIVANILSAIAVSIVFNILSAILSSIFSFAFEMFVMSGRMQGIVQPYYSITAIVFDFILLVLGLELIGYFLNKKRYKENFDECSNDRQN